MKKRYIFLIVSLISVVTITYFIKSDYANTFITETKEEIEYLHNEKDSIFSYVDETINNLDIERKEKQFKLDSLDIELIKKQKIVNQYIKSIEDNKILLQRIEEDNKKLLKEKNNLSSTLVEVNERLVEVTDLNEYTQRRLDDVKQEKENIYNQYSDLKEIYQNNTFVVVDTIYKIDTICYTKDEIKKLILRNRGE